MKFQCCNISCRYIGKENEFIQDSAGSTCPKCLHTAYPTYEGEKAMEETKITNIVTEAVRKADKIFRNVGGSTRHWVRDCFIPTLEESGLCIRPKQEPHTDDWEEFRAGCPAKEETGYGDGRNLVEICTLLKGRWPCIKENCVACRAAKWNER